MMSIAEWLEAASDDLEAKRRLLAVHPDAQLELAGNGGVITAASVEPDQIRPIAKVKNDQVEVWLAPCTVFESTIIYMPRSTWLPVGVVFERLRAGHPGVIREILDAWE